MKTKAIIPAVLAALLAAAPAGCRRTDVRTFEIKVSGLTQKNAPGLVGALMAYEGVSDVAKIEKDSISVDTEAGVVKVRYDSMKVAKKNLEMAIALAGYEANGVTPESVGAKRAEPAK